MKKVSIFITVFLALFIGFVGILKANEVNIFSARHYDSDIQLYQKFAPF